MSFLPRADCVVAIILAPLNYWFTSATGWKPKHATYRPNKSVCTIFLGFVSTLLSLMLLCPDPRFAGRLKKSAAPVLHPQVQQRGPTRSTGDISTATYELLPWRTPHILTIGSVRGLETQLTHLHRPALLKKCSTQSAPLLTITHWRTCSDIIFFLLYV